MQSQRAVNTLCWLSLVLMALAWHFPGEIACTILSWAGCLLLVKYLPLSNKPYGILYSAGLALYAIGFYWLFFTIRDFGGFNNFFAFLIFAFFISVSALQFILFVFVWKKLPLFFHSNCLALATAWLTSEMLSIRIFPWYLGHSQLAYTYFAQVADIAGAVPISFLMILFSDALCKLITNKKISPAMAVSFVLFIASNIYGYVRTEQFSAKKYPKQNVTLVQANISLEEKHDILLPKINIKRYIELSTPYKNKDTLLVWPESVLTEFVSSKLKHVSEDRSNRIPYFENTSILFGALTFESKERFFNSALGIAGDGQIIGVYHKQILMPFGEFTPFSGTFPWLKDLNATAGEFTAGEKTEIISFPLSNNMSLKVAPLICYEDVIPQLAREAALNGAEILINITNDAWFGNTIAPYEHNLIASFRSIENRRYLLRATNTGLTAIIDPLGKTVASIKPYSDGVINYDVERIDFKAPSSYYDYQFLLKLMGLFFTFIAFLRLRTNVTR